MTTQPIPQRDYQTLFETSDKQIETFYFFAVEVAHQLAADLITDREAETALYIMRKISENAIGGVTIAHYIEPKKQTDHD